MMMGKDVDQPGNVSLDLSIEEKRSFYQSYLEVVSITIVGN